MKDADFYAHVLVAFFAGGGMSDHRARIAQAFVAQVGGVEALLDEIVVDKFCAIYGKDEEWVFWFQGCAGGVAIPVDLEIVVPEILQEGDATRKGFAGGIGEDGCIGDEVDVVEPEGRVRFVIGTRFGCVGGRGLRDVFYLIIYEHFYPAAEAVVAGKWIILTAGFETCRGKGRLWLPRLHLREYP